MRKMLLTGTTQGIGRAIYDRFSDRYDIYTVNRRDFPGTNYVCDLFELAEVEQLCQILLGNSFDILINNAGGGEPVIFSELSVKMLENCTNLNYHAPVLLMQAVLEGMKIRGYGRIVNISSIASKSPRELIPHYGAAKAALEFFSKSMAVCYGGCNITINCVCPGGVETSTSLHNREQMAILQGKPPNYYNSSFEAANGLGRMVTKEEVVDLVEFLISDRAEAISGQSINICGTKEVHG